MDRWRASAGASASQPARTLREVATLSPLQAPRRLWRQDSTFGRPRSPGPVGARRMMVYPSGSIEDSKNGRAGHAPAGRCNRHERGRPPGSCERASLLARQSRSSDPERLRRRRLRGRPGAARNNAFRIVHTGYLHGARLEHPPPAGLREVARRVGRWGRHPHPLARLPAPGDRHAGEAPIRRSSCGRDRASDRTGPDIVVEHGYRTRTVALLRSADLLFLRCRTSRPDGGRARPGKDLPARVDSPDSGAVPRGGARPPLGLRTRHYITAPTTPRRWQTSCGRSFAAAPGG
jgi:hypothetical protein